MCRYRTMQLSILRISNRHLGRLSRNEEISIHTNQPSDSMDSSLSSKENQSPCGFSKSALLLLHQSKPLKDLPIKIGLEEKTDEEIQIENEISRLYARLESLRLNFQKQGRTVDANIINNDRQTLLPLDFFLNPSYCRCEDSLWWGFPGFEDGGYTREELPLFLLLVSTSSCFTDTIFTIQGFAAGLMLSISFFDLAHNAINSIGFLKGNLWFFGGVILFAIIANFIPEPSLGPTTNTKNKKKHGDEGGKYVMKKHRRQVLFSGIITAVGISLHNFPEGMAVFLGSLKGLRVGLNLALAIALHNIPETEDIQCVCRH